MTLLPRQILQNGFSFAATAALLGIFCMALAAPLLSPFAPADGNLGERLQPPLTKGHLLGTDPLGRDVLSRIIYGARVSVAVGLAAVLLAGIFGTALGLVSGFYGGWLDRIIMRFVDMQLSFPFVILSLTIAAVLGSSFQNIIITLAISSWVVYARLVRGEVLSLREKQFIQAAFTLGLPDRRIIVMHILPNIIQPMIVLASLEVGRMIIGEAAISFLGYGIQPPVPTWGNMLGEGRDYMTTAWWLTVFPGGVIMVTTLAVNILGDRLRDILDPKLRLQ